MFPEASEEALLNDLWAIAHVNGRCGHMRPCFRFRANLGQDQTSQTPGVNC